MKKSILSALSTVLLFGTAPGVMAAANPFTDVPSDHWAYDAVTQLAADGVVDGYGDCTFRGDNVITRYEMAQVVAKAMTRNDLNAKDKGLLDKLAAEFSDELNSLGTRVAKLEKHFDNIKWNGKIEYTASRVRIKNEPGKTPVDNWKFRFEPEITVNTHWKIGARMDMDTDTSTSANCTSLATSRCYANGTYGKWNFILGRHELNTFLGNSKAGALSFDTDFNGVIITHQSRHLRTQLISGRKDASDIKGFVEINQIKDYVNSHYNGKVFDSVDIEGLNLDYTIGKFDFGAGYYFLRNLYKNDEGKKVSPNLLAFQTGYRFDHNFALTAAFAKANKVQDGAASFVYDGNRVRENSKAYQVELAYKGADQKIRGSWGAYVAYRSLGFVAAPWATTDGIQCGFKGVEIGAEYTLDKNIVLCAKYADFTAVEGSAFGALRGKDGNKLWSQLSFYF